MNDQEFTWMLEECIQTADNYDVEIEEECRAVQAMEVHRESDQLGPTALGNACGQIERRYGQALHF
ncbi:hypothetical protein APR51_43805 [Variovorax paradoxus]|nr:hypothetical protein APR51_43805 [Variovorax paradoxus]